MKLVIKKFWWVGVIVSLLFVVAFFIYQNRWNYYLFVGTVVDAQTKKPIEKAQVEVGSWKDGQNDIVYDNIGGVQAIGGESVDYTDKQGNFRMYPVFWSRVKEIKVYLFDQEKYYDFKLEPKFDWSRLAMRQDLEIDLNSDRVLTDWSKYQMDLDEYVEVKKDFPTEIIDKNDDADVDNNRLDVSKEMKDFIAMIVQAEKDKNYGIIWDFAYIDDKNIWLNKDDFIYYWSRKKEIEEEVMWDLFGSKSLRYCPQMKKINSWQDPKNGIVYNNVYEVMVGNHIDDRTYGRWNYYQVFHVIDVGGEYFYFMSLSRDKVVEFVDNFDPNWEKNFEDNYSKYLEYESEVQRVSGYFANGAGWANMRMSSGNKYDAYPYCEE
ncbi:MAG: hypothetical protein ACOZAR_03970 [Patescibacteria group bacterium]